MLLIFLTFLYLQTMKMARPQKQWLDYFSMDVEKDNKLKFLKAKFWTLWFWMYIELLQFIYKEWYFVHRNDDTILLFMSETWLKEEEIELMLEFMLLKWLLNKDIYDKYKILTSNWIQKRYAEWTRKRKNTAVDSRLWCVWDYEHIELMEELTELSEELTELNDTESTQSKVKESKGKESKVNEPKPPKTKKVIYPTQQEVEQYFDENWYTKDAWAKAFRYYETWNWSDSKWNKVKNWKQKMQSVRFKDENKKKPWMKTLTPEEIAERTQWRIYS